ncbi:YbaB/EbfC family nucleoid-associated protein [Actinoplanes sp. N902-109]|uniref:YbaB/EbfC family nucleoid-associated protein n=1 Tax=Actinoplanes sp. (strain N902-109) TaxID=649831 RepID=UPI0003293C85|nr:YbaB/EbfC family nucleoid-associated protein [Actinoplanes sp. N902-109]AGL18683.1 hypothetical protein L083_5173 [Actinoplanes sp. N902-109]
MDDIDATEEWLQSWAVGVDRQAEQSAELTRRVAAVNGEAASRDGAIRVVVKASGQVDRLELDDRVRALPGQVLAGRIMEVLRLAEADVSARVADQAAQTVGTDTETGRAVVQSFETRFPAVDRGEQEGARRGW